MERRLEVISGHMRVIAWTCSECSWRMDANDDHSAAPGTIEQFMRHHCSDYEPRSQEPEQKMA